jgi:hypothetical protein
MWESVLPTPSISRESKAGTAPACNNSFRLEPGAAAAAAAATATPKG